MPDITAEQIKAARAALGWTIIQIAEATGIGSATLKRYEASLGIPKSRKGHLGRLREHFEAAGIEFIGSPDDRPGIRIGKPPAGKASAHSLKNRRASPCRF